MRLALGEHSVARLARLVDALRRGNLIHACEARALPDGVEHYAL